MTDLQGKEGKVGARGDTGARGKVGATGPHGDVGLRGDPGARGHTGTPGVAWMTLLIVIVVAFTAVAVAMRTASNAADQVRRNATCLTAWANQTTHRATLLQGLNTARSDALDQFIRDFELIVQKNPNGQAQAKKDLLLYISASNAYRRAVRQHPIPESPRAVCNQ